MSLKLSKNSKVNILSVYYPKGPNADNSDWIRNIPSSDKNWIILGDFNAHSPFWEPGCSITTCKRFVENIIDSKLVLMNDGSITRVPDISSHRPSSIDLSLISPDLSVHASWATEDDTLGSDHLPIIIKVNEEIYNEEEEEDAIPKFLYKSANWDMYQAILMGFNHASIRHEDSDIFL